MSALGTWLDAHRDLDRLDRELLVCRAVGLTRAQLLARPQTPLEPAAAALLGAWAARRRHGEPLAYILGSREFWGLEFDVSPAVLVPRPESELLVELALDWSTRERTTRKAPATVLELGTGSGAIAVALAVAVRERGAAVEITASDVSAPALALARHNASRQHAGVRFLEGDWYAPVRGRFGLIVANPPYVADADPHLTALRHEPRLALCGGDDGLDALRRVVAGAAAHLHAGGRLAVEHGACQGAAVRGLFEAAGFVDIVTLADLAGLDRVSHGRRPEAPR